jgi:hypothetical protein
MKEWSHPVFYSFEMPRAGHYSGVYPLLHRGTTYVHFRVHFSRYPQGNALNPARVDMRENEGRMALNCHPSG